MTFDCGATVKNSTLTFWPKFWHDCWVLGFEQPYVCLCHWPTLICDIGVWEIVSTPRSFHDSVNTWEGSSLLGLLSPSGDLGIGLVWHNLSGPPRSFLVRLLKSSPNWTKLSMRGPKLFSGWNQIILDVFQCSQLFSDVFRLFSDDVFRLLKSSSSWTKLSMMSLSCSQDDIRWF